MDGRFKLMNTIFEIPDTRRTYCIFTALMVFISAVTFANLVTHNFWDGWDDWDLIADISIASNDFKYLFSAERLLPIRTTNDLVFLIGYLIWGPSPVGYHILQICLHLFASLLLAYTSRKLGADVELSLVGSLFFLVNTSHFRAVHWITVINYNLAFIFSLFVVLAFLKFLKDKKPYWIVIAIFNLVAAVFAHPSAVSIAVFCTYLAWHHKPSIYFICQTAAPLVVAVVVIGISVKVVSPNSIQDAGFMIAPELTRLFLNYFWYLGRLISTAFVVGSETVTSTRLPWEIVLGVFYFASTLVLLKRRVFPIAHWGVFSLLTVLPFVNTQLWRLAFGPSRQLYFASAGFAFVLAWCLRAVVLKLNGERSWLKKKQWIWGILVAFLTVLGIYHLKKTEALSIYFGGRGYAFRVNQKSENGRQAADLYERAIRHAPHIVPLDVYRRLLSMGLGIGRPYQKVVKMGRIYHSDRLDIEVLEWMAVFTNPSVVEWEKGDVAILSIINKSKEKEDLRELVARLMQNLGGYYHAQDMFEQAVALYQRAIEYNPNYAMVYYHMGNALSKLHRYNLAVASYNKSIALNPDYIESIQNIANVFFENGDFQNAEQLFRKVVRLDTENATAFYNLGIALFAQHKYQEAETLFRKTVDMDTIDWDAYSMLGETLFHLNKFDDAIVTNRHLFQNQPHNLKALKNLGLLFLKTDRYVEAVSILEKAVGVAPDDLEVLSALAFAYEQSHNFQEAIVVYKKLLLKEPDNLELNSRLQLLQARKTP
ncbi:MAG: tetratricopeptide (TPR) repeat protein [Candidatus Latescibacterota bacterium]|jgi:tetratricopeptide (TPR) repeat protein